MEYRTDAAAKRSEDGEREARTAAAGRSAGHTGMPGSNGGRPGTVYLVGAGPGDPGLITARGLQAIREAGCIVYDRLSSPELLKEAGSGCELIYVGKADRHHTMPQEDINLLLVQKSMEYDKTVRLKGGDVYVFGRGGEEGICLREHGIPFEVIPGVTSAVAGPAYAGIPVTHRGMASGFHVVTAHDQRDGLSGIDFAAMARGNETCIFLMGLSRVKEIADRLLEAGMPETTEAAVISCATTQEQRVCAAELSRIAEETARAGLVSPAVIVVGKTVSLRGTLGSFGRRPLSGRRYLIPVTGKKASGLRELLRREGAAADEITVGEIVRTGKRFDAGTLRAADWIIFTSRNGVEAFFSGLAEIRLDVRALAGCRIAVVGRRTAGELEKRGLYADLMPERYDSGALAEALKRRLRPQERVWYAKAENADSHLKEALEGFCRFEEIALYENRAVVPDLTRIRPLSGYDGVIFTCASSADRFLDAVGEQRVWKRTYSIGPKTTACLKRRGIGAVAQAGQCDYEGILELLLSSPRFPCPLLREETGLGGAQTKGSGRGPRES